MSAADCPCGPSACKCAGFELRLPPRGGLHNKPFYARVSDCPPLRRAPTSAPALCSEDTDRSSVTDAAPSKSWWQDAAPSKSWWQDDLQSKKTFWINEVGDTTELPDKFVDDPVYRSGNYDGVYYKISLLDFDWYKFETADFVTGIQIYDEHSDTWTLVRAPDACHPYFIRTQKCTIRDGGVTNERGSVWLTKIQFEAIQVKPHY